MTHDIVSAISWTWRSSHLLLCCSVDGVLTDVGDQPGDERVPASRRDLLASLASLDSVTMCVASGRRLAQLQSAVGRDRRLYYIGLRGMEIEGPQVSFFHLGAAQCADVLAPLATALHPLVREVPGLVVEYRNLYLAVRLAWLPHPATRQRVVEQVRELAAPFARTHRLRLVECGDDMEVLPDLKWTTADAIREVKLAVERVHGRCAVVVVGNGRGEDDAFGAVKDAGLAVHVGDSQAPAAFRLADAEAAEDLLLGLVKVGHGRRGPGLRIAL